MRVEVTFQMNGLNNLDGLLDEAAIACQDAMAGRFAEMARENIGSEFGSNRPMPWAPLSPKYAKRVGRKEATLYLTGALFDSIQTETGGREYASCYTDNPYALAHQEGVPDKNLPRRSFFPVFGGELTPYAEEQCLEAAQRAFERVMA